MSEVVITVHPEHHGRLDAIAEALRELGLENAKTVRRFGFVMGDAASEALPAMEAVEGVKTARKATGFAASEAASDS